MKSDKYRTRRGKKHFAWKGNKVGNLALHSWVNRTFGKANKCELCKTRKIPYKKKHWFEWSCKTGVYNRSRKNWWRLCVRCHRKYDNWSKKLLKSFLASRCWEKRQRDIKGKFV